MDLKTAHTVADRVEHEYESVKQKLIQLDSEQTRLVAYKRLLEKLLTGEEAEITTVKIEYALKDDNQIVKGWKKTVEIPPQPEVEQPKPEPAEVPAPTEPVQEADTVARAVLQVLGDGETRTVKEIMAEIKKRKIYPDLNLQSLYSALYALVRSKAIKRRGRGRYKI